MAKRKVYEIGAVKVYRDSEWQEYIVKRTGHPDGDYYTNDKTDAINTAQWMHLGNVARQQASGITI